MIRAKVKPKQDTLATQQLGASGDDVRRQVSLVPFSSGAEVSASFIVGANKIPNPLRSTKVRYILLSAKQSAPSFYLTSADKEFITFESAAITEVILWVF